MTNNQPTKAIIAVAGYGTRWLPVTKALEKCMIPVGDRPIVDYAVDNCIKAGITDIIFVVGEQSHQIRTYYGHNQGLEDHLVEHKKIDALMDISDLKTKARFHYVTQGSNHPYGTNVTLWLARNYIKPGEQFLFMFGDNIHYSANGDSVVAQLIAQANEAGASDAMLTVEVPHDRVQHYGIVDVEQRNGREYYKRIQEKPKPEEAATNLNNAGCFLLRDDVFASAKRCMEQKDAKTGEHLLTDTINWYREAGNEILAVRSNAEYLDCGTVPEWVAANNRVVNGTV